MAEHFNVGDTVCCYDASMADGLLTEGLYYTISNVCTGWTSDEVFYVLAEAPGTCWSAKRFYLVDEPKEEVVSADEIKNFVLQAEALNDIVETIKSFHGHSEWDDYDQGYVDALKDFAYHTLGVYIEVDTSPRVTLTPVDDK